METDRPGDEMKQKAIPDDVKEETLDSIEEFNKGSGRDDCYYQARFRGRYLYLDRCDYGTLGPVCRLTYTGKMDDWQFAIFKWSTETYDADEWMFPGRGEVDGMVEGAMKAGLQAYPV